MGMARLAEKHIKPSGLPTRCSSCWGQYPKRQHIDFDAACDRGFYGDGQKVVMDDLILCETCVGEAARLLGYIPSLEYHERLSNLERKLEEEKERANKGWDYADRMEEALAHRPEKLKINRPIGRPPKVAA